jgi:ankyrin repeat protein
MYKDLLHFLQVSYILFLFFLISKTNALACFRGYDQEEIEAITDRIKCVEILLEAGANVNHAKKVTKLTPLHWAAFNDDKKVVKYLM